MIHIKKLFFVFLALVIAFPLCVKATPTSRQHNWFFYPATGHKQPQVFGGNSLPYKYGSLSIGSPDEKVVYLTFDAGYGNESVVKILDDMKEQGVKSTFFILPGIIKNSPEIVKRLYEEGHIVANHTFSHKNMANITDKTVFLKDLTDLEDYYYKVTGQKMSRYFRPPEGSFSEKNLEWCKEAGFVPVFWSFAYKDWDNGDQKDPSWAKQKILENVHNGMVMLIHPTSSTNAAVLGDVIKELKSQGYRFGTLDELNEYSKNRHLS